MVSNDLSNSSTNQPDHVLSSQNGSNTSDNNPVNNHINISPQKQDINEDRMTDVDENSDKIQTQIQSQIQMDEIRPSQSQQEIKQISNFQNQEAHSLPNSLPNSQKILNAPLLNQITILNPNFNPAQNQIFNSFSNSRIANINGSTNPSKPAGATPISIPTSTTATVTATSTTGALHQQTSIHVPKTNTVPNIIQNTILGHSPAPVSLPTPVPGHSQFNVSSHAGTLSSSTIMRQKGQNFLTSNHTGTQPNIHSVNASTYLIGNSNQNGIIPIGNSIQSAKQSYSTSIRGGNITLHGGQFQSNGPSNSLLPNANHSGIPNIPINLPNLSDKNSLNTSTTNFPSFPEDTQTPKSAQIDNKRIEELANEFSKLTDKQLHFKIEEIFAFSRALDMLEEQVLSSCGRRWKLIEERKLESSLAQHTPQQNTQQNSKQ